MRWVLILLALQLAGCTPGLQFPAVMPPVRPTKEHLLPATVTPSVEGKSLVGQVFLAVAFQHDRRQVILDTAKQHQAISYNADAAIAKAAWINGHLLIGNEADVILDSEWQGVAQLAVNPQTGQEFAYFATNLTTTGEWTVDVYVYQ